MSYKRIFPDVKERWCLKCDKLFRSRHNGIRICDGCKHYIAKNRDGLAGRHRHKVHAEFMKTGPTVAEIQSY